MCENEEPALLCEFCIFWKRGYIPWIGNWVCVRNRLWLQTMPLVTCEKMGMVKLSLFCGRMSETTSCFTGTFAHGLEVGSPRTWEAVISFFRDCCVFAWQGKWLVHKLLEVVEGQYLAVSNLFSICCLWRLVEIRVRRAGMAIVNVESCQYVVIFEERKINIVFFKGIITRTEAHYFVGKV